jgi:hypothetical protein
VRPPLNSSIVRSLRTAFIRMTILGALFAVACGPKGPPFQSSGVVTNESGQPVAGAEAWVQCGQTDKSARAVTDASGHFVGSATGTRSLNCMLVVHAAGFADVVTSLASVCRKKPPNLETECLKVSPGSISMKPLPPLAP